MIISLGGGTPCYGNNMQYILNSSPYVIYLEVSAKELSQRLSREKEQRPLISHLPENELLSFINKHLFDRNPFYRQAHIILPCTGLSTQEITQKIEKITKK